MTKPHEETWEAWPDGDVHVVRGTTMNIEAGSRAPLIAQAPAMARLLLKIEWNGGAQGDSGMCPSCFQFPTEHAPDCELATVLRAAGVLP